MNTQDNDASSTASRFIWLLIIGVTPTVVVLLTTVALLLAFKYVVSLQP